MAAISISHPVTTIGSSALPAAQPGSTPIDEESHAVLPDFCSGATILKVVVVAELVAMVIVVLTQTRYTGNIFAEFVTVSLFIQWIAMVSSATLCSLRRWLNTLPAVRAVIQAYLVLLAVVVVVSELVVWVLYYGGYIDTARPHWYGAFHGQNFLVAVFINALVLHYLLAIHQLRVRTANAVQLRSEVRRYRVRPRFLFNALNNIAGLMRRRPAVAEAATEELADLVRLMLNEKDECIPVNREVASAQKFISLENLRLDDRLVVHWNVENSVNHVRTPVQIVQLLMEYVIDVGVEPYTDGGTISVTIGKSDGDVLMDVVCDTAVDSPGNLVQDERDYPEQRLNSGSGLEDSTGNKIKRSRLAQKLAEVAAVVSITHQGDGDVRGEGSLGVISRRAGPALETNMEKNMGSTGEEIDFEGRQASWLDTSTLDNIKLRLHDIYGVAGALTIHRDMNRLLIRVKHPAEGGSH